MTSEIDKAIAYLHGMADGMADGMAKERMPKSIAMVVAGALRAAASGIFKGEHLDAAIMYYEHLPDPAKRPPPPPPIIQGSFDEAKVGAFVCAARKGRMEEATSILDGMTDHERNAVLEIAKAGLGLTLP